MWLFWRQILHIDYKNITKTSMLLVLGILMLYISYYIGIAPNVFPLMIPLFLFFLDRKYQLVYCITFFLLGSFIGLFIHSLIISIFLIFPVYIFIKFKKLRIIFLTFYSIVLYYLFYSFFYNIDNNIINYIISYKFIFLVLYSIFINIYPYILFKIYLYIKNKINFQEI